MSNSVKEILAKLEDIIQTSRNAPGYAVHVAIPVRMAKTKTVKLQELTANTENSLVCVLKVMDKRGRVSSDTETTFQKVMSAIRETDRPLPNPDVYLGFEKISEYMSIKGSPLFLIDGKCTDGLVITSMSIDDDHRPNIVSLSDAIITVRQNSVYLVRNKQHPTGTKVEI